MNTNMFDILADNTNKRPTKVRWADEVDTEIEDNHIPNEVKNINENYNEELDKSLKNLKMIDITHDIKTFNGTEVIKQISRKLKIVSKDTYINLKNLIERHRPYKKDSYGNEVFDHREQLSKIKLTNELMNMCYKIDKYPVFVYSVILIEFKEHTSLVSHIYYNSSHVFNKKFRIIDIEYSKNK